ncbi:MAG: heavy-metal-associated domain-containing protein [Planctomycetes bacterium]|nr:heavy-metal-associated domain-containing protein [Planctomycetota bacterium]
MTTSPHHTYLVPDMSCSHCEAAIRDGVSKLDGVRSIQVDLDTKIVTVEGGDDAAIRAAIDDAGFTVEAA